MCRRGFPWFALLPIVIYFNWVGVWDRCWSHLHWTLFQTDLQLTNLLRYLVILLAHGYSFYVHLIPWHKRICQSAHSHLWIAISLVHCTILFPARGTWKGIVAEWMPLVHWVLLLAWKATTVKFRHNFNGLMIPAFADHLTLISGLQMSLVHCKLQFGAWPYLFTNLKNDFDPSFQTSWSVTVKKFSFRNLPNSCQWISSDLHLLCCNLGALTLHTVGYSFGGALELCPCIWFALELLPLGCRVYAPVSPPTRILTQSGCKFGQLPPSRCVLLYIHLLVLFPAQSATGVIIPNNWQSYSCGGVQRKLEHKKVQTVVSTVLHARL